MFATTIFLTRIYDPDVYGEFRLLFSFISLMVILFITGRDKGIIYFTQSDTTQSNQIIAEEIVFGLIALTTATIILFMFNQHVIDFLFNKEVAVEHFNISLFMLPLWGMFNLILAGITSKKLINQSFILTNFTQRVLRIPFFIFLSIFSISYYSLALSMLLSQLILIYLALQKLSLSRKTFEINLKKFFKRFSYAIQLGFNAILLVLLTKIDVLMIGKFIGNVQVAIYDIGVLIAFTLLMPYFALVESTEPFMQSLKKDIETRKKYNLNLKLTFELGLVILLLYLMSNSFILSIFGETYLEGSAVVNTLAIGFLVSLYFGSPIEFLNMNNLARISSVILTLSILINVVLNILLIPFYGLEGVAFATVSSLIVSKVVALIYTKYKFEINLSLQTFPTRSFSIFLFLLFVFFILPTYNSFTNFILGILASMLLTIFIIFSNNQYRVFVGKFYKNIF